MSPKEIKLPSGATLKISLPPMAVSKALYQAILEEARGMPFGAGTDLAAIVKEIICIGYSSKRIEACLAECFKRVTYDAGKGELKIDGDTFESREARGDYLLVCFEVTLENLLPFEKGLTAVLGRLSALIPGVQQ